MKDQDQKIGFLLGNPEADARRAIVLHASEEEYLVDKLGLGEAARKSVVDELDVIQKLPEGYDGLPVLKSEHSKGGWASYTTQYLAGQPPRDSDRNLILDLLRGWMAKATFRKLSDTRQWKLMASYVKLESNDELLALWEGVAEVSNLEVKVGLFHGDFARWNIKVSIEGEVHVMDWEHGCLDGPAGWDWLHYLVQRATLVDHLPASEVLNVCRTWMDSPEGRVFLNEAGWGDDVEMCLKCYLLYSGWIEGFDRGGLISSAIH